MNASSPLGGRRSCSADPIAADIFCVLLKLLNRGRDHPRPEIATEPDQGPNVIIRRRLAERGLPPRHF